MLRRLHLRLTVLYVLAGLALIVLVAGGAYSLLRYYFERTTDLALQYKMARELAAVGAELPPELLAAGNAWQADQAPWFPARQPDTPESSEGHEEDREGGEEHPTEYRPGEDAYDGELAVVFVLPLRSDGTLLSDPNPYAAPLAPDQAAVAAALAHGHDWRTVTLGSGTRVRLLTYALDGASPDRPAVLQVGRPLDDQDRLLSRLLAGLLALGAAGLVLLGASSWWLAGRSLVPAQQALERQQAFVANASHELRTPLTLMRASAEVAQRSLPGASEASALLSDVLAECDHTSHLVDDLLLLSRLDAGRLPVTREAVALPDLFADLQRQMGRVAAARGVNLIMDPAGATVLGDPVRLRQVLLILLDNALQHTPSGGTVRVDVPGAQRQVHLRVSDTGPGITPEHLPHVFERFYRVDDARGHGKGAGLGLAIAKALVEAQHGRITIESRPGQGTQVGITLPVGPS